MKYGVAFFLGLLVASHGAHAAAAQTYSINAEPYVITVTVTPQIPQAVISASPNSGAEPLATTINWSSVNGTGVTVKLDGHIISSANAGSYSVNNLLQGTHTAEISVTGPGGSVSDSAAITVSPALDPDAQAYLAATGATNATAINNLVKALKTNNRWNNFAALLFKSSENYSSGTTVKGLGPLAGDCTLINGPTLASDGVTFDGVNDHATWTLSGFHTWNAVTRISRSAPAGASQADTGKASFETMGQGNPDRHWSIGGTTTVFDGEMLAAYIISGSVLNRRTAVSAVSWSADEDHCLTLVATAASQPAYWKNTNVLTPILSNGSTSVGIVPANSGFTANDTLYLSSVYGTAAYVAEKRIALVYFNVALPAAEIVEYTNLINAL